MLRRFGLPVALVACVLWGGAWLYKSGIAADGVTALRAKAYQLTARAGFAVNDIYVEGRFNSDPDMLRAILNLERGDPILAFNPAEARAMIENLSWVREAHVERRFPSTIYIGLVERTPMALWQNKGKIRVIDHDGITLTDDLQAGFGDLPIIVGEDAPENAATLLRAIAAEPVIHARLEAATWIGARRWDLKLKNGIEVKLPEDAPDAALRRLVVAQEEDGLMDRDVLTIDMRDPDRIVVRTRPGAAEEYRKSLQERGADQGNNI